MTGNATTMSIFNPAQPERRNPRWQLALDITRNDYERARRLMAMPLFAVAVDGHGGMIAAHTQAVRLEREAA